MFCRKQILVYLCPLICLLKEILSVSVSQEQWFKLFGIWALRLKRFSTEKAVLRKKLVEIGSYKVILLIYFLIKFGLSTYNFSKWLCIRACRHSLKYFRWKPSSLDFNLWPIAGKKWLIFMERKMWMLSLFETSF